MKILTVKSLYRNSDACLSTIMNLLHDNSKEKEKKKFFFTRG